MTKFEYSGSFTPTRVHIGTKKRLISKFIEYGCADFNINISGDWDALIYLTDETESISLGFKTIEAVEVIAADLMERYPECKFYLI